MKLELPSSPGPHRNSLMSTKGVFWLLGPGVAHSLQEVETFNVQCGLRSLTGRAEPQRWLPPALLGGPVSTGRESEALPLKHVVAMPTNGRGQENGNRKVREGNRGAQRSRGSLLFPGLGSLSMVRNSVRKGLWGGRAQRLHRRENGIGSEGILSTTAKFFLSCFLTGPV